MDAGWGRSPSIPRYRSPSRDLELFEGGRMSRSAPTPTKASSDVVVHEPAGLHESVADGRPDKAKAALLQIPAHRVRLRGGGRNVAQRPPPAPQRLAAHESPDIAVERTELLLHAQQRLRVRDGRLDLEAVAHDAFVLEKPAALRLAERGNPARIESGEGPPVCLSLAQDGAPREARLPPPQDHGLREHPGLAPWPP